MDYDLKCRLIFAMYMCVCSFIFTTFLRTLLHSLTTHLCGCAYKVQINIFIVTRHVFILRQHILIL